ncbi:MAG: exosortase/archaeosortase family protein [Candidatus Poseidoniaceae archaeon]
MGESASSSASDDMSWGEVAQLGLRYGKIPLALLAVEALYWFITQPSDTLALIQVTEAYIWNEVTQLMFGEGASTLSTHNGWMTRIDFHHESFPGALNSVGLYVSDECAGVHEMIFLSTLVLMTDGVTQREKFKAVAVMCGIVYVLNIVRLVAFYPIAVEGCLANPNQPECLNGMWNFHTFVYQWGFLIVLLLMWLVWFKFIGGASRTMKASQEEKEQWRVVIRKRWEQKHFALIGVMVGFFGIAWFWINGNSTAMDAKNVMDFCAFSDLTTPSCYEAQNTWDNAIQGAWSFAVLGLVLGAVGFYDIERKDSEGNWPTYESEEKEVIDLESKSKSKKEKPKGSWRNRSSTSEEE